MVISRLARVNAWPRLASTMAFLCLMPAHFECPDTYARTPDELRKKTPGVPAKSKISWGGNIFSYILLQAYSNEISFTRLQHVAILENRAFGGPFSVDSNPTLLD